MIKIILFVVIWLSAFSQDRVISHTYSPRKIMTDITLDYAKHCKVKFGAYGETHEDSPCTNTMAKQLQGCIFLVTTKNSWVAGNFSDFGPGVELQ